jgi:hypothetical protein
MTNVRLIEYWVTTMVSRIPHTLPNPTMIAIQRAPRVLNADVKGDWLLMSW